MKDSKDRKIKSLQERILIASTGSAKELSEVIYDRNSKVVDALLSNPRMDVDMVIPMIKRNQLVPDHIKRITNHPIWITDYKLRLEIILYPRTPRALALRYIKDLFYNDLALVSRNVMIHPAIREVAERYLRERLSTMRLGEKISLARDASINILRILLDDPEFRVFETAMSNTRLSESEVLFFASKRNQKPDKLLFMAEHPKWSRSQPILQALAVHPKLGYGARKLVFQKIHLPLLVKLIRARQLNENHRSLARFIVHQRIREMSSSMQEMLAQSHYKALLTEVGIATTELKVMEILLSNPKTDLQLVYLILKKNHMEGIQSIISNHDRWKENPELQKCCTEMNDKILRAQMIGDEPDEAKAPDPQEGEDQS